MKNWGDDWPQRWQQNIRLTSQVTPLIQEKAHWACGGVCPACQAKTNDFKVSQRNDPAEIEADYVAGRV